MKNKKKKLMFFLGLFSSIGFFGFGESVRASCESLVITEIMYALEGSDSGNEWIELFNNSENAIILEKSGAYIKNLKLKNNDSKHNLFFQEGILEIGPEEFIILTNNTDIPEFRNKYKISSGTKIFRVAFSSLIDTAGTISISCDNGASFFGSLSYLNSWGGYENGKTLEKIEPDLDNSNANWQESENDGGTPGEENSIIEEAPIPNPEPEPDPSPTYSEDIIINELFPSPKNSPFEEFVEFYNAGDEDVDLKGWKLKDDNLLKYNKACTLPEIKVKKNGYEYFNLDDCDASITLRNEGDSLFLFNPTDTEYLSGTTYEGADYDVSWSFDGDDWHWASCVDCITPGAENKFDPIESDPEPKIYPSQIRLNEVLPNPKGKDDEYIEIKNESAENIDLIGWILRDATKTKKYVLTKDDFFNERGFLVIKKPKSKLSLNDSGAESVKLLDPSERLVSEISYSGAKDGISYNWNGSRWRWSKHLTPGAENVFDDEPSFKVEKDKVIYKNFPAKFDVNVKKYKKSKTKITWDFGDGHKSYKKAAIHKYQKKGKYAASVKIFNGSEEVIKTFKVEVKDFPKYDVEIIAVNPNPDGSDTELE